MARLALPQAPERVGAGGHSALLDVVFGQHTDRGKVREQNQDFYGHFAPDSDARARSPGWLFVLADGVGGHEQGEVATRLAVESMREGFRRACGRDLNEAARQLVALARERDGSDNISVQPARVRNIDRVSMYRGRP